MHTDLYLTDEGIGINRVAGQVFSNNNTYEEYNKWWKMNVWNELAIFSNNL